MNDDELPKMSLTSMDVMKAKREQLKNIFPEVFTEDKIDFELLSRVLGHWIEPEKERYNLCWPGKANCMNVIQEPSIATLKPERSESVDFDNTQNIFIEGDNLEVLKLLQKAYFGKIKMIYIDPPYNTGKEFIYPDKFQDNLNTYLVYTGQIDGNGRKFSTNTDIGGRFHSNWLNMMYPRLFLARNLLSEDGIIFISIDDNEVDNLKLLCDSIFGADKLTSRIVVQSNKSGQAYKDIAKCHEYILVYYKSENAKVEELSKASALPFTDEYGEFELRELRNRNPKFGRHNRPNLYYPIFVNPSFVDDCNLATISLTQSDLYNVAIYPKNSDGEDSCWRWSAEKLQSEGISGNPPCVFGKLKKNGGWNIYEKSRKSTTKAKSLWLDSGVITGQGTVEAGKLGLAGILDFPKPLELIKRCIQLGSSDDDVILDFFSGSSTTAHAVFMQNLEDGQQRQCISVQLPEPTFETIKGEIVPKPQNKKAFAAGLLTIAEIGKERIRKAGEKIKEDSDLLSSPENIDLGFKVFKLSSSNFSIWKDDVSSTSDLKVQLEMHINNVDPSSSPEDILYELILKAGFELTVSVEKQTMAGKDVFVVANGNLLVCLDKEITPALVDALAEYNSPEVICLDVGFRGNDELKANAVQAFKSQSRIDGEAIVFHTV